MGILSLGAVLEQQGIQVELFDLNRLYYQYVNAGEQREKDADFCSYVRTALESLSADVFGFSTICSSYPLTLRLARGVRATHPGALIILGGPQASVVAPGLKRATWSRFISRWRLKACRKSTPITSAFRFSPSCWAAACHRGYSRRSVRSAASATRSRRFTRLIQTPECSASMPAPTRAT